MSGNTICIWMGKVGGKLVTWSYIGIEMADGSKKLLKNILSLTKLDNRRTITGFYDKKKGRGRKMSLDSNS